MFTATALGEESTTRAIGTLNQEGCIVFNNTAMGFGNLRGTGYGGGIFIAQYGTLGLNGGSIDHNYATAPSPSGSGIYNQGTITGNNGLVHDNT